MELGEKKNSATTIGSSNTIKELQIFLKKTEFLPPWGNFVNSNHNSNKFKNNLKLFNGYYQNVRDLRTKLIKT
jgi:hypothetical protein